MRFEIRARFGFLSELLKSAVLQGSDGPLLSQLHFEVVSLSGTGTAGICE